MFSINDKPITSLSIDTAKAEQREADAETIKHYLRALGVLRHPRDEVHLLRGDEATGGAQS